MSEIAIDAVQYLDRIRRPADLIREARLGGPAKVQRDAQGAILEVNQGRPSCTRPTFAGSNMHHDHSDMPALGPATAPLASIPILLQQRRSVGCITYPLPLLRTPGQRVRPPTVAAPARATTHSDLALSGEHDGD